SGALRKRGQLDGIEALVAFADRLEKATLDTIEGGVMTKDLTQLCDTPATGVTSEGFIGAIAKKLAALQ
ncbi:MAG: NADP-dependent isocitrate dehydrogenase, partial [Eubacteriales bacterium]|nr:NADP-dependent isocitrate dehydrogenase [Eubacteriales bacterium]